MGEESRVIRGKLDASGVLGPAWIGGWLFTIGFLHLSLLKAVLGLALWPYYIGVAFHH